MRLLANELDDSRVLVATNLWQQDTFAKRTLPTREWGATAKAEQLKREKPCVFVNA